MLLIFSPKIKSVASKTLVNLLPSSTSTTSSNGSSPSVITYATDLLGFLFLPFTIIWGIVSNVLGIGAPAVQSGTMPTPATSHRLPANDDPNRK